VLGLFGLVTLVATSCKKNDETEGIKLATVGALLGTDGLCTKSEGDTGGFYWDSGGWGDSGYGDSGWGWDSRFWDWGSGWWDTGNGDDGDDTGAGDDDVESGTLWSEIEYTVGSRDPEIIIVMDGYAELCPDCSYTLSITSCP
jgi:hypothetical protein